MKFEMINETNRKVIFTTENPWEIIDHYLTFNQDGTDFSFNMVDSYDEMHPVDLAIAILAWHEKYSGNKEFFYRAAFGGNLKAFDINSPDNECAKMIFCEIDSDPTIMGKFSYVVKKQNLVHQMQNSIETILYLAGDDFTDEKNYKLFYENVVRTLKDFEYLKDE